LSVLREREATFATLLAWDDDQLLKVLASDPAINPTLIAELVFDRRTFRAAVKATWNEDTRKLRIAPTFKELKSAVAKAFGLVSALVEITWLDDDEDKITIANDSDLEEAFSSQKTLKVYVKALPPVAPFQGPPLRQMPNALASGLLPDPMPSASAAQIPTPAAVTPTTALVPHPGPPPPATKAPAAVTPTTAFVPLPGPIPPAVTARMSVLGAWSATAAPAEFPASPKPMQAPTVQAVEKTDLSYKGDAGALRSQESSLSGRPQTQSSTQSGSDSQGLSGKPDYFEIEFPPDNRPSGSRLQAFRSNVGAGKHEVVE
jgi:hypothetical protein